MWLTKWLVAALLMSLHSSAFAHGGGLNADGCHNNRKTGDYHCHRGASGNSAAMPLKDSSKVLTAPSTSTQRAFPPGCFVGPRGGTYTITKSGRKNYSGC